MYVLVSFSEQGSFGWMKAFAVSFSAANLSNATAFPFVVLTGTGTEAGRAGLLLGWANVLDVHCRATHFPGDSFAVCFALFTLATVSFTF